MTRASGRRGSQRLYDDLAWTWPIISPPEDYVDEAEEHWRAIASHARGPVKTLLHLGCGGGHLDRTLKEHVAVTGVDRSPAMLDLARTLNPEVEYIEGDMRTVRLGRTFDAVLIADSIAYMCTEADLLAAFRTAFVHLGPGGVFFTYVEQTPDTFREGRTTCTTHTHSGVEITYLENLHDPDPRDTTVESRFLYLIRDHGKLRIERDLHRWGIFPLSTWRRLLARAGFAATLLRPPVERTDPEAVATFVGIRQKGAKPARKGRGRTRKRSAPSGRRASSRRQ